MVSVEQAREVALFYLLSLLDESLALQAAHKSIAQLKAMTAQDGTHSPVSVARVLHKGFEAHRRMLSRNRPTEISDTALQFPEGTDFATWQKFHRQSSDAEITAVVLTKILGYSESAVAEGFGVSMGTMKFRVAKGIRQLGSVVAKSGSIV